MKMHAVGFDWSAPRFVPVGLEQKRDHVVLRAGGTSIRFRGKIFRANADAPLTGRVRIGRPASSEQGEFLVLSLDLEAKRDTLLRELTWFAGEWDPATERAVASTGTQDNVLFLRRQGVSFFLSLDFPFSRITPTGISYPAGEMVRPGRACACHSLSVGACRLSGQRVDGFDRAEIEAVIAYVEPRHIARDGDRKALAAR